MKLIDLLQGKWLGHPLHPALVHVPIGAWLVACVLDVANLAGWTQGGPGRLALFCVAFGLAGAVLAAAPGLADWLSIKPDKPAKKLGVYHLLLNVAAMILWSINLIQRFDTEQAVTPPIMITSAAGTLLVLAGGYLGSLLAFDHGIAVARFSKQQWRERAVREGARVPEEN
ncbi:MAG TPA: DUF2231 domain-containing protein [Opitutus sp.]|nr:DUF2231 domain-containing protein [Opitutus sp.]